MYLILVDRPLSPQDHAATSTAKRRPEVSIQAKLGVSKPIEAQRWTELAEIQYQGIPSKSPTTRDHPNSIGVE
jgi:hypothetical protein